MNLSVIIPVFNEVKTIQKMVEQVRSLPVVAQVIIADDASIDGTQDILQELAGDGVVCLYQPVNRGKGSAIRAAIPMIRGECAVIQDADTEYDPIELKMMVMVMEREACDVVYGSRYLKDNPVLSGRQMLANRVLTGLTNILYGSRLTDMETCYKMMKREVWQSIHLTADRFDIEPEITARLLQTGHTIREVPITYKPRDYIRGKKIGWRDAVSAVFMLFKCRFVK